MTAGELVIAIWSSVRDVQPGTWISLAGWIVTGIGWYVSQRGQRRSFIYQARNIARGEVVNGLRSRQDVVGELAVFISGIQVSSELGHTAGWNELKWLEQFNKYRDISAAANSQWIYMLEQCEVLFPETARCRRQAVQRSMALTQDVQAFCVDLLTPATRDQALARGRELSDRLHDEIALLEDFLVHIQNVTLGQVVRCSVAFRQPQNPNLPRIVMRNGQLEIVQGVTD